MTVLEILWNIIATTTTLLACYVGYLYMKIRKYRNIPQAQTTLLQNIKGATGRRGPWYMKDIAKGVSNYAYHVMVPKPRQVVIVVEGKLGREIYGNAVDNSKSRYFYDKLEVVIGGRSLATGPTDAHWKMVRKGAAPAFAKREISRINQIAKEQVERWIRETLNPIVAAGGTFDPSHEMVMITFRVICLSVLEYDPTDEEILEFWRCYEFAGEEIGNKQMGNPIRYFFRWLIPRHWQALQASKTVHAFGDKVVEAYKNNNNKSTNNTYIGLLSKLDLSHREFRSEVVLSLIAGHDTTGYTLSNALHYLAKNPDIMNELRKELRAVDQSKWADCKLLQYVIKETHRILPSSALGTPRILKNDLHVKRPDEEFTIPGNTTVFPCILAMAHNPTVFDNPDTFDPYRWENATPEMHESVVSFSAGPRNCIGYPLAVSETNTVLGRLVHDFHFEIVVEGYEDSFLTTKIAGMQLKANPVDNPTSSKSPSSFVMKSGAATTTATATALKP